MSKSVSARFATKLLYSFFVGLTFLLFSALAWYLGTQVYRETLVRAHQSCLKQAKDLESQLRQQVDAIHAQFSKKTIFNSWEEMEAFHKDYFQLNQQMNKEVLTERDYKNFLNGGKPGVSLILFNYDSESFQEASTRSEILFTNSKLIWQNDGKSFPREEVDYLVEFSKLGINLDTDPVRRTIHFKSEHFKVIDEMDGFRDFIFDSSALHRDQVIPWEANINNFTWLPPGSPLEKEKTKYKKRLDWESKEYMPLIWSLSFVFRKHSRFKRGDHRYIRFLRSALRFRLEDKEGEAVPLEDRQIIWRFFPTDFLNPEGKTVPLFPPRIVMAQVRDSLVLRKLFVAMCENIGENNVVGIIQEEGWSHSNASGFPIKSFQNGVLAGQFENRYLWQEKDYIGYSYASRLGSNFVIHFAVPLNQFLWEFYLKCSLVVLSLGVLFLYLLRSSRKQYKKVIDSIQSCFQAVLNPDEANHAIESNEFTLLQDKILGFQEMIQRRIRLTKLQEQYLTVLQQPRLRWNEYLENFRYLCADLSERYFFRIADSSRTCPNPQTTRIDTGNGQFLEFASELESEEKAMFQSCLSQLVERSSMEEKFLQDDKLKADLSLAQRLYGLLLIESPPQWLRVSHKNEDKLDFDCVVYHKREGENAVETLIYLDFFEKSLKTSLIALTAKSYLTGLLETNCPMENIPGQLQKIIKTPCGMLIYERASRSRLLQCGTPFTFVAQSSGYEHRPCPNPPVGLLPDNTELSIQDLFHSGFLSLSISYLAYQQSPKEIARVLNSTPSLETLESFEELLENEGLFSGGMKVWVKS